jgi:hypothetical protein
VLNAFMWGVEGGCRCSKGKPLYGHALLQNIISEDLNWQATYDTSFSLPIFNKIARCNTPDDGKIIAEKCTQGE